MVFSELTMRLLLMSTTATALCPSERKAGLPNRKSDKYCGWLKKGKNFVVVVAWLLLWPLLLGPYLCHSLSKSANRSSR